MYGHLLRQLEHLPDSLATSQEANLLLANIYLRLADVSLNENNHSVAKDHPQKAHTGLSQLIHQDLAASSYV